MGSTSFPKGCMCLSVSVCVYLFFHFIFLLLGEKLGHLASVRTHSHTHTVTTQHDTNWCTPWWRWRRGKQQRSQKQGGTVDVRGAKEREREKTCLKKKNKPGHANGFSPVWIRVWCINACFVVTPLPQIEQVYRFSPRYHVAFFFCLCMAVVAGMMMLSSLSVGLIRVLIFFFCVLFLLFVLYIYIYIYFVCLVNHSERTLKNDTTSSNNKNSPWVCVFFWLIFSPVDFCPPRDTFCFLPSE